MSAFWMLVISALLLAIAFGSAHAHGASKVQGTSPAKDSGVTWKMTNGE